MGARLRPHWTYPQALVEATFVGRRKRFFADAVLPDGTEVVAHCANTGSMQGMLAPPQRCRLQPASNPKRSLRWDLEQLHVDGAWIVAHTARPNAVVAAAVRAGDVPELDGYEHVRTEVRYGGNHRIDLFLADGGLRGPDEPVGRKTGLDAAVATRCAYVEVKNVTLRDGPIARFPDAVTARGTAHLHALIERVEAGHRAVMLFFLARADVEAFAPADAVDPVYGEALRAAVDRGVEVVARVCEVGEEGLRLGERRPVLLERL